MKRMKPLALVINWREALSFIAVLSAIVCFSTSALAVEDGLGTNVMRNIRIQPTGVGVIDLSGTAITNWNQVGSTADVASLQGATNALNTTVTNEIVVRAAANAGISNTINTLTTAVYNATNTLNTAITNEIVVRDAADAGISNTLNTRAVKWDNAVICKQGHGPAGTDAINYTNLYYLAGGTVWSNANATSNATAHGLLGIALGSSLADNGLLLNGMFSITGGFAVGSVIYMDTNNNSITTTIPSGTNQVVRIVGYAVSDTNIYFNPDRTYIEMLGP